MKRRVLLAAFLIGLAALGPPAAASRAGRVGARQGDASPVRYRIDAKNSSLVAHARRGGLLWFLGHDHLVAAREFAGVAEIAPGSLVPASLEVTVRADSLGETSSAFTEQQKKIIDGELRTIVLLPDRYPEITFKSTGVTAKPTGAGRYRAEITGNVTLLGVTHEVVIPAEVALDGEDLRARGEFGLERGDFGVKATSAKRGTIRVRDKLELTFDIVAHRE